MYQIIFKDKLVFEGFAKSQVHPKLIEVLQFMLDSGIEVTMTESSRKKMHADDLHGVVPLRAVDVRSWIFDDPERVATLINEAFIYDPRRKYIQVCIYHDVGLGKHFHIQVHPDTIRKQKHKARVYAFKKEDK